MLSIDDRYHQSSNESYTLTVSFFYTCLERKSNGFHYHIFLGKFACRLILFAREREREWEMNGRDETEFTACEDLALEEETIRGFPCDFARNVNLRTIYHTCLNGLCVWLNENLALSLIYSNRIYGRLRISSSPRVSYIYIFNIPQNCFFFKYKFTIR